MRTNARSMVLVFVMLLSFAACGKQVMKPYASPMLKGVDVVSLALLPFENLTEEQSAAKTVEGLVLVEILKRGRSHVVDPGEVNAALLEERIRVATSIPRAGVKALGERLGVDYLLQGVVHEFQMQRMTTAGGAGETPVVSLTLRLVDTRDGEIVWALSASSSGNDRESVFGIGRVGSLEQLAQRMIEGMADSFAKSHE